MKKLWLVIRYELMTTIRRRSFLLMAIGIPLLAAAIFAVVQLINRPEAEGESDAEVQAMDFDREGLVDQSGWVTQIPPDFPPGVLTLYPDVASARAALQAGEINSYTIIPADGIENGDLIHVAPRINPLDPSGLSWMVGQTLVYNFLGGDLQQVEAFWQPMIVERSPLGAAAQQESEVAQGQDPFPVAYPLMLIFYVLILTSSSLLMNSVTGEKKNRVVEIMMTTIRPRVLLAGKIIALGAAGLLQMILWTGTFYFLVQSFYPQQYSGGMGISIGDLVWGLVFFVLGYAVYASLMAAMGAMLDNPREASQSIFLVIAPLVFPLFFFVALLEKPFSTLSTVLSLIPFTAPVAMMTRLGVIQVPLWQLLVSSGLLLVTAVLVVLAAARVFRTNILLSGQKFSPGRYFRVLLGLDGRTRKNG